MKIFIKQLAYFLLLPVFAISVILMVLVLASEAGEEKILDNSFEAKVRELYNPNFPQQIIIAGDSRAERQLDPKVMTGILGAPSFNMAGSSLDIVTTLAAIKKYNMDHSQRIFVISASSYQANDGAISRGSISLKAFQKMSLTEKIFVFRFKLKEFVWLAKNLIREAYSKKNGPYSYDSKIIQNLGFHGVKEKLNLSEIPKHWINNFNQHPWYSTIKTHGARHRILSEALEDLGQLKARILIFQPPVSPAWRESISNSFVDKFEKAYAKDMNKEIRKFENIKFLDFYAVKTLPFSNEDFYDPIHLNSQGAMVFSEAVANIIQSLNWN